MSLLTQQTDQLISDIKKRKGLQQINNQFVKEKIDKYFKSNPKLAKELQNKFHIKSAIYRQVIKAIREKLRRVYGLYRQPLPQFKTIESIPEILASHPSTKDRLPFYTQLYQQIFSITGQPKSIMDLGCGINPLSLIYMKIQPLSYCAYDISEEEIALLNSFFQYWGKDHQFSGKAVIQDIRKVPSPVVDLAFLFKITDVIEGKDHKITENILQQLNAKHIVISFPTITMSGRKMNFPKRKWLELLCQRCEYEFSSFEFPGEIFYVVKKK